MPSGNLASARSENPGSNLGSFTGDKQAPIPFTDLMDASSAPRQTICLVLEVNRTSDGHIGGRIRTADSDNWSSFSGVLELLKVLEDRTCP